MFETYNALGVYNNSILFSHRTKIKKISTGSTENPRDTDPISIPTINKENKVTYLKIKD